LAPIALDKPKSQIFTYETALSDVSTKSTFNKLKNNNPTK